MLESLLNEVTAPGPGVVAQLETHAEDEPEEAWRLWRVLQNRSSAAVDLGAVRERVFESTAAISPSANIKPVMVGIGGRHNHWHTSHWHWHSL